MQEIIAYDSVKRAHIFATDRELNINYYITQGEKTPFSQFFERIPELTCLLTDEVKTHLNGVNIIFEESLLPNALHCQGIILITSGLLEHLWLSSYIHYSLYRQTPWGNPDIPDNTRELQWSSDMIACLKRLKATFSEKLQGWSVDLPKPTADFDIERGNIEDIASEIALHALMGIILHETKHYLDFKNSYSGLSNMQIEHEADNYAIKAFTKIPNISELPPERKKNNYQKRILSLLEMGSFLSFSELSTQREDPVHPNGIYRIHNILKKQSKIFNLVDDRAYNPEDDITDIRPLVQYANFILNIDSTLALPEDSAIKQEMYTILENNIFDSPLSSYKELVFFLSCNLIEIHISQQR